MTDQKALIKQLVDAPYGKAEEILREKGFWDEKRVPKSERSEKEFDVTLTGSMSVSAVISVFAKDKDEARRKARDEVSNTDFDEYGDVEDISVETVEEAEE